MQHVAIVEYGMGNVDSVARAVEECGGNPVVTSQAHDLEVATHIILPGVGAFTVGMRHIYERGLDQVLGEQVLGKGIPLLGICLGMQLLATKGWEGGESKGLGWIDGEVQRLQGDKTQERIPHVGWNEVTVTQRSPLFHGISSGKDFYFVHSYHFNCQNVQDVLAYTPYCGAFISAVWRENIFGVQFHPEKSQRPGFQVLKNFIAL